MLRVLQENIDKQLNDIRKKYKNNMRSSTKRQKKKEKKQTEFWGLKNTIIEEVSIEQQNLANRRENL